MLSMVALIWQALLIQAAESEIRYKESIEHLAYTLVMSCISLFVSSRLGDTAQYYGDLRAARHSQTGKRIYTDASY